MKKARDPKLYFILAGVTVVAGAGFTFTQYNGLSDINTKIDALRKENRDSKQVYTELEKSKTDLADLKTKLNHLEKGIPDIAYMPTMLKDLETSGKSQGIMILGVRPIPKQNTGKKEEKKAYDEIEIEIKGRGTYGNVLKFVKSLNSFPKIVATRSMNLSPKASGPVVTDPNDRNMLDLQLRIRAYVFKTVKPAESKEPDKNKAAA